MLNGCKLLLMNTLSIKVSFTQHLTSMDRDNDSPYTLQSLLGMGPKVNISSFPDTSDFSP